MTSLFLVFVLAVAGAAMLVARWRMPDRLARTVQIGLPAWLLYVGVLSWSGWVGDASLRPPAIVYIVVPVVLFIVLAGARSAAGRTVALALPLWLLVGAQSYRVVVELFLHRLAVDGLVPRMLTYEGANFDLVVGASAPLMAWLCARERIGSRVLLAWNVIGLAALANVMVRSALTAPGPLHLLLADPPNLAIGTFPYTYIAGFLAPLAVTLHVLTIRAIRDRPQTREVAVSLLNEDRPPGWK